MGDLVTQSYFGSISLKGRIWDEARPLWPYKNLFTGKRMMPFKLAARARIDSQYGPVSVSYMEYIVYWTTPQELIMQKLKGNA